MLLNCQKTDLPVCFCFSSSSFCFSSDHLKAHPVYHTAVVLQAGTGGGSELRVGQKAIEYKYYLFFGWMSCIGVIENFSTLLGNIYLPI